MVYCGIAIQRLTAPAETTEDAEKTAVFIIPK
jgi:hypothetical protein